jgi:hypothetical protein
MLSKSHFLRFGRTFPHLCLPATELELRTIFRTLLLFTQSDKTRSLFQKNEMTMASTRLFVPKDSPSDFRNASVTIDRRLVSTANSVLEMTKGQLNQFVPETPTENAMAFACNVTPEGLEAISTLADFGASCDACIVYQQQSIPDELLAVFPAHVHGLLQRPRSGDIVCVSTAAWEDAGPHESLISIWLRCGAKSITVGGHSDASRFPKSGPGQPIVSAARLKEVVNTCQAIQEFSEPVKQCFCAGVLLLWDCLEESHQISQSVKDHDMCCTADYWHGMMHRREPDLGNAGYWFRRVGRHPAMLRLERHLDDWLAAIGQTSPLNSGGHWNPDAVIAAWSEALGDPASSQTDSLRAVQYLEILNLLAEPWVAAQRD